MIIALDDNLARTRSLSFYYFRFCKKMFCYFLRPFDFSSPPAILDIFDHTNPVSPTKEITFPLPSLLK